MSYDRLGSGRFHRERVRTVEAHPRIKSHDYAAALGTLHRIPDEPVPAHRTWVGAVAHHERRPSITGPHSINRPRQRIEKISHFLVVGVDATFMSVQHNSSSMVTNPVSIRYRMETVR